jgi:hypothetical protein
MLNQELVVRRKYGISLMAMKYLLARQADQKTIQELSKVHAAGV